MTISIPNWLPNWLNENAYPDPETTSPRLWAWEYLRRNTEYQRVCDEIGVSWFDEFRNIFLLEADIQENKLIGLINPSQEEMHQFNQDMYTRLASHCYEALKKIEEPQQLDLLAERFYTCIPDHPKQAHPLVVFTTDLFCYRPTKKEDFSIKTSFFPKYPQAEKIRLLSLRKRVNERIKRFLELTEGNIIQRDPGGHKHRDYLRVLDANMLCGDTYTIAEELFSDPRKTSNVEKNYLVATDYVNGRYISLPPPFPPKKYNLTPR